ncbi:MAG: hypothetical protein JWR89_5237 [Tardiphaga sp.]|jgi:hypothetical protein|nr:hypothetical protein [Tardiphaga sp.]
MIHVAITLAFMILAAALIYEIHGSKGPKPPKPR